MTTKLSDRGLDKRRLLTAFFVVSSLAAITFILSMKSNFNFFVRGGNQDADGDVFCYTGWLVAKGYVPYRDFFDHKGPFLFLLQYIGTLFGHINGIWIVEMVFIAGAVILSYMIARKFNGVVASLFTVLLLFARYAICGYSNCSEEFSMAFQLIALYYFIDFYRNRSSYIEEEATACSSHGQHSKRRVRWFDLRVAIIGLSFGCVFFMKANFCAVWIVFCLAIFIECLMGKHWMAMWRFILSFLLGAAVIAAPIGLYLIKNHAVTEFIYDYFTFNSMYSSVVERVNIFTKTNSLWLFVNTVPSILSFIIMAIKLKQKGPSFKFDVVHTVYMVVTVFLVTMAGATSKKMELALFSTYIYPLSQLFTVADIRRVTSKPLAVVVVSYLIITLVVPMWSRQMTDAAADINTYVNEPEKIGWHDDEGVKYILNNTDADDKIAVFGNQCVYYLYTEREPASPYIYLPDPVIDGEHILEEYFEDLDQTKPKIIVVANIYTEKREYYTLEMNDYLKKNHYKMVVDGDFPVYQLQK